MISKNVFNAISYSSMWKHEFRDFVFQLTEVVAKYDPESMRIEFVASRLNKALLELDLMDIDYRKHPLSAQIQDLGEGRNTLIQAIVMQVKIWKKTNRVLSVPELTVVAPFVEKYLRPLFYKNGTILSDYLRSMFTELDASDELKSAIVALKLNEMVEELRGMQVSYLNLRTERRESREHIKVKTEEARRIAKRAIENLISKVNLNQMEFPELDYVGLINETNELSAYYKVQHKSRATSRKKSKSKKSGVTESASTDVYPSSTTAIAVNWDSEAVAKK